MSAVVYTKTPKGLRESSGKTRALSKDMRELLKACNGWFTIGEIAVQISPDNQEWIGAAIAELAAAGYLRDVPEVWREDDKAASESNALESLDFSAAAPAAAREVQDKTRLQAKIQSSADEVQKPQNAEQKQQQEAAEKNRLHHEARRREEEERNRRSAEENLRGAATEKPRREAAATGTSAGVNAVAEKLRAEFASRRGKRDEATSELIKEIDEAARKKAAEQVAREAEERARREEEERVRREANEKLRREVEEHARRVAEEKARREAEERERREAEERIRREAAERVRREAEEKARLEAEEKARREAAERARRDEEERIRREAEEKLRRQAEEQARREAEEQARREAAEQARRAEEDARRRKEEERLRRIAEKKAREEAEEKARLEQEERDREAIRERIRQRNRKRRQIALPIVFGLVLPVGLVLLVLQFFSFDGKRSELEKIAAELVGAPVKIGSAKLSVLAGAQWMLDDVTTGSGAETVKINRIRLATSWLNPFGTPARVESIQLEGARLPPSLALKLLIQTSGSALLQSGNVTATGLVFSGSQGMPPLDLRASFQQGRLTTLRGRGEDADSGKISLDMSREAQWQITLGATQMRWILGPGLPLTDVTLKAELMPGSLQVTEFSGTLFDGGLAGSGNLSWQQDGWRTSAKLEAKLLDSTKFAPAWSQEGRVNGSAVIIAEAATAGELASRARTSGRFNMNRGLLAGVDLERVVQNNGLGEQFRFESLQGDFFFDSRSMEFSELKLVAGDLQARGALSATASGSVSGLVNIEIPTARRAASLRISGTLAAPRYQR